jgi:hypothetical protein
VIKAYRRWLSEVPSTPDQCARKGLAALSVGAVLVGGAGWMWLEVVPRISSGSRLLHLAMVFLIGIGLTLLFHSGLFFLAAISLRRGR